MTHTYTHTSTYTFTQTEVVVIQFEKALGYVADIINKSRRAAIAEAISKKQISAIGIYALNEENKRVAEVELEVDWEKHNRIVKTFGELFEEGQSGINPRTGEAEETKVFVYNLVKSAREKGSSSACVK